jgi:WD40 repeat protein
MKRNTLSVFAFISFVCCGSYPDLGFAQSSRTVLQRSVPKAGQPPQQPSEAPQPFIEAGMHTSQINSIGTDASCKLMATGSQDRTLRIWELPNSRLLRTIYPPTGLVPHSGQVDAVGMAPDGSWVAAGVGTAAGGFIYVFATKNGEVLWRSQEMGHNILQIAVSANGANLAASLGSGGGLRILRRGGTRETSGKQSWTEVARDTNYGNANAFAVTFDHAGAIYAAAFDGRLRKYAPPYRNVPTLSVATKSDKEAAGIAVSTANNRVAVVFANGHAVDIHDATNLAHVKTIENRDIQGREVPNNAVAWSSDGQRLYFGGDWPEASASKIRGVTISTNTSTDIIGPGGAISHLMPCGNGIAFSTAAPAFGLLGPENQRIVWQERITTDMRGKRETDFLASDDGRKVQFGLKRAGRVGDQYESRDPVLFDIDQETLVSASTTIVGNTLLAADTDPTHVNVTDWYGYDKDGNKQIVKLNGKPLKIASDDWAHGFAIAPDQSKFAVATDMFLYGFKRDGTALWPPQPAATAVWGAHIPRSGKVAIAAHGDGTIRWYRMSDGAELLALFVHALDRRWIAWTPQGYYMASAKGEDLLGYRINRNTWDKTADFARAVTYREKFNRPDIVKGVLTQLDVTTAIAEASKIYPGGRNGAATGAIAANKQPLWAKVKPVYAPPASSRGAPPSVVERSNEPVATTSPVSSPPTTMATSRQHARGAPGQVPAPDQSQPAQTAMLDVNIADVIKQRTPPVVVIDGTDQTSQGQNREVRVFYIIRSPSGEPVSKIYAFVNGELMVVRPGPGKIDGDNETGWLKVNVPRAKATVRIIAETQNGIKSEPADAQIASEGLAVEDASPPRMLFALIVGIGQFPDGAPAKSLGLTPANDADVFEAQLKSQIGEGKAYLKGSQIRKLTDRGGPIKKLDIETAIFELKKQAEEPGSVALFYFSGHGKSADTGVAYLLPSEYDGRDGVTSLGTNYIVDELFGRSGPVLIFIDACQSAGGFVGGSNNRFMNRVTGDFQRAQGFIAFASSWITEASLATEKSFFTEAVVDGLKGAAAKPGTKWLRARELDAHVFKTVETMSNGRQKPAMIAPDQQSLDLVIARYQ